MENIYRALKPNGILIFHERIYDLNNATRDFNRGHPIRIKSAVFDHFLQHFDALETPAAALKKWQLTSEPEEAFFEIYQARAEKLAIVNHPTFLLTDEAKAEILTIEDIRGQLWGHR